MYKNNIQEKEAQRNLNCEVKRYDLINFLIEKHSLINYLEIGVFQGENIRKVRAPYKNGVDPGAEGYTVPEVDYPLTSDEFFELIKDHPDIKYDIIFIDGLHHSEQVDKDIDNSLKHLTEKGFIIVHDCSPISYEAQKVPRETIVWNGDVWKSIVKLRIQRRDVTVRVVDTDFGVGVITKKTSADFELKKIPDWEYFDKNRKEILTLISTDEFKKIY